MIECEHCGCEYPPARFRWRCPECGWKSTCCEGEPLAPTDPEP